MAVCAVLAALYAGLTVLLAPISYGAFQCRVSEALTLLPFFAPYTMWGLFIGCFLANLYTGSVLDIVFGSLATLLAAFLTSKCKNKWLAALPPVLVNAVVIGAVIAWSSAGVEAFWADVYKRQASGRPSCMAVSHSAFTMAAACGYARPTSSLTAASMRLHTLMRSPAFKRRAR